MGAKIDAAWEAMGRAAGDIGNTYQAFLKADSILPVQFPVYETSTPQPEMEPEITAPEIAEPEIDLNNS
jgi:hypothetical protein